MLPRRAALVRATSLWRQALNYPRLPQPARASLRHRRSLYETRAALLCTTPSDIKDTTWPEHDFVRTAEACLEHVCEQVCLIGFNDTHDVADFDADLSQGVLTISLGSHGTYVLNTQTPNRQIWLSSPHSGPRRFAWHSASHTWLSTRDGSPLHSILTTELSDVFSEHVSIDFAAALKSL